MIGLFSFVLSEYILYPGMPDAHLKFFFLSKTTSEIKQKNNPGYFFVRRLIKTYNFLNLSNIHFRFLKVQFKKYIHMSIKYPIH